MAPGGVYNHNSQVQQRGLIPGMRLLERAASAVDLPDPPQPIMIADYGCAGGRNSLAPVAAAIEVLRRRANTPITVAHTDLPDNDFSALFDTLWSDPASYTVIPAVFPMVIGRSFYHQVLPHDSVTLGWSSWSGGGHHHRRQPHTAAAISGVIVAARSTHWCAANYRPCGSKSLDKGIRLGTNSRLNS